MLAGHFVDLASRKMNRTRPRLTQAGILQLQQYDWPGNVRELQNVIERSVITAQHDRMKFELPSDRTTTTTQTPSEAPPDAIVTDTEMRRRERENVLTALRATNWKISGEDGAADLLGLKPTTLASRMKKMSIERPS